MKYPAVMDEWATIRQVRNGYSIARLGDGEFKLADGQGYSREFGSAELAQELRQILTAPHPHCLPAIPTMDPKGPKGANWARHKERYARLLTSRVTYYSAFITRPDSAPTINCREYAELCVGIWAGKRVAVVCERTNKILALVGQTAGVVHYVPCPSYGAYAAIDELTRHVLTLSADVVLVSCGPTATCMANRLADRVQTIDIGSAGGFIARLVNS